MIPKNEIDEQIAEWRTQRRTAPFVQHLVMQIVDEAARSHYPNDYPMKCLQTAGAIQHVLLKLGITAQLYAGAVCFTKVDPSGKFVGWTGSIICKRHSERRWAASAIARLLYLRR